MRALQLVSPGLFGSTRVAPGELLVGDIDGVVTIPRSCEAEVIERAVQKAKAEREVRSAIENGMSSTDAFARHRPPEVGEPNTL